MDLAEARRILGVTFCHGPCQQDTIPLDVLGGRCGFCETQLVEAKPPRRRGANRVEIVPDIPPERRPGFCAWCEEPLPKGKHKYCKPACRQAYWLRYTDAGARWLNRTNLNRGRRKAAA